MLNCAFLSLSFAHLSSSPAFCPSAVSGGRAYSFYGTRFGRSISSFIISCPTDKCPLSAIVRRCTFSNILAAAYSVSSTSYYGLSPASPYAITASGSSDFSFCIFQNISTSSGYSAGISVMNAGHSFSVTYCSFILLKLSNTGIGGSAIFSSLCESAYVCSVCFYRCFNTAQAASYGILSLTAYTVPSTEFNFTVETGYLSSDMNSHTSFAGGTSHFCFFNNNVTGQHLSSIGGGLAFITSPNSYTVASFCLQKCCSGPYLMHINVDGRVQYYSNIAIVNSSTTTGMINPYGSSDQPIFTAFLFVNCSFVAYINQGSVGFISCVFSQAYSSLPTSYCYYTGCSYGATSITEYSFQGYTTIPCRISATSSFTSGPSVGLSMIIFSLFHSQMLINQE